MDRRPERIRGRGRDTFHEDGHAQPVRGVLEGGQERPDGLDVVADMGDERDIGPKGRGTPRISGRPASLDDANVLDRVVLGDLRQSLEHRARGIERDDRPARPVERASQRQREPAGAGADIEPRIAGSDEIQQHVQDGVVGPRRVGPEERGDRRVEVLPVGDLADPLHLLAVGADAAGPGGLEDCCEVFGGIHVRIVPRGGHLGHAFRVSRDDRTKPTVAGRLSHEPEGGRPKQDGVPPGRPGRPGRRSTVLRGQAPRREP